MYSEVLALNKCTTDALFFTVSREKSENCCALSLALSSRNCDLLFWTQRQTQTQNWHARSQHCCLQVSDLNTGDNNEFPEESVVTHPITGEITQELNSTWDAGETLTLESKKTGLVMTKDQTVLQLMSLMRGRCGDQQVPEAFADKHSQSRERRRHNSSWDCVPSAS